MVNAKSLSITISIVWINQDWFILITDSGKKSISLLNVEEVRSENITELIRLKKEVIYEHQSGIKGT